MAKPKAAQLIKKIQESKGNISAVARAYNAPRSTVYSWIQSYPTAMEALSDEREQVVDVAESILFKKIIEGELGAVFYTLNNSPEARARGWAVKEQNINHKGGITVNLSWGDDGDA